MRLCKLFTAQWHTARAWVNVKSSHLPIPHVCPGPARSAWRGGLGDTTLFLLRCHMD